MTTQSKVLMVCTGNICRSPAMHYLAARDWADAAIVTSAGTEGQVTMDAPPEIRQSAAVYDVTVPTHQPRQLTAEMIVDADLVLVATESHARWIEQEMGEWPSNVFGLKQAVDLAANAPKPSGETPSERLRNAAEALRSAGPQHETPLRSLDDPWAHDQATYDRVMGEIVDAMEFITDWAELS